MSILDAFIALKDDFEDVNEGKAYSVYSKDKMEKARKFLDEEATKEVKLEVIDVDADSLDHVKDGKEYVGQMLLQCASCRSVKFCDMDALAEVEGNTELYNIEDECPHCHAVGTGFTLLGQVGKVAEEDKPQEEEEVGFENDEASEDEAKFDNDVEEEPEQEEEQPEEASEEPEQSESNDEEDEFGFEETNAEDDTEDMEDTTGDEYDSDDVAMDDTEEQEEEDEFGFEEEPEKEEKPKKKRKKAGDKEVAEESLQKQTLTEDYDSDTVGEFFSTKFLEPEKINNVKICVDGWHEIYNGSYSEIPFEYLSCDLKGFSTGGTDLIINTCVGGNITVSGVLNNYNDYNSDRVHLCDWETNDTYFSGDVEDAMEEWGDAPVITLEVPNVLIIDVPASQVREKFEDEDLSEEEVLVENILKANNFSKYKVNNVNSTEHFIKESIEMEEDLNIIYEQFVLPTKDRKLITEFKKLTGYKDNLDLVLEQDNIYKDNIKVIKEQNNKFYKACKNRKELSEELSKLKNNNQPYSVKKSTNENYRYDIFLKGNAVQEKLIPPTSDLLKAVEGAFATCGFKVERRGKTILDAEHYQIISLEGNNTEKDLESKFDQLQDMLEDLDKAYNAPITMNMGLGDDGYITAGVDVRQQWVKEEFKEYVTESLKLTSKEIDELFKLCKEIGIESMDSLKDFMKEVGCEECDILQALRNYREKLGPDFKINEDRSKFNSYPNTGWYVGEPYDPYGGGSGKRALYYKELIQYFKDKVKDYPEYYIKSTTPTEIRLKTPDGIEAIDLCKFDALGDADEAIEMASHYFDESSIFEEAKYPKKDPKTGLDGLYVNEGDTIHKSDLDRVLTAGGELIVYLDKSIINFNDEGVTEDDYDYNPRSIVAYVIRYEDDNYYKGEKEYVAYPEIYNDYTGDNELWDNCGDSLGSTLDEAIEILSGYPYHLTTINDTLTEEAKLATNKSECKSVSEIFGFGKKSKPKHRYLMAMFVDTSRRMYTSDVWQDILRLVEKYVDTTRSRRRYFAADILNQVEFVATEDVFKRIESEVKTFLNGLHWKRKKYFTGSYDWVSGDGEVNFDIAAAAKHLIDFARVESNIKESVSEEVKLATNKKGDYLVAADSGKGYTVFSRDDVRIGGFDGEDDKVAVDRFMNGDISECKSVVTEEDVRDLIVADPEVETVEAEFIDEEPVVGTEVDLAMDERDREIVDELRRISKDIKQAIEDNYNIEVDERLILQDMIQDLRLISGDLRPEDLPNTPINELTKEMYNAYNGFMDALDELESFITGTPITRSEAQRLRMAVNSLYSDNFSTETINRLIGSQQFLSEIQRGAIPYIDRNLLGESYDECDGEEECCRYYVYKDGEVISDGFEFEEDAFELAEAEGDCVVKKHCYYRETPDSTLKPLGEPEEVSKLNEAKEENKESEEAPEGSPEELVQELKDTINYEDFVRLLKSDVKSDEFIKYLQNHYELGDDTIQTVKRSGASERKIKCGDLIPTQNNISFQKSVLDVISGEKLNWGLNIVKDPTSKNAFKDPTITYQGKYIIDGHHRWSKAYALCGPDAEITCLDFPKIDGVNVNDMLKATQLAIVAKNPNVPLINPVEPDNMLDMGKDAVSKKVSEVIDDKMVQALVDRGLGENKEQVCDKVGEYVDVMSKNNQPDKNAPARDYMPQTDRADGSIDLMKQAVIDVTEDVQIVEDYEATLLNDLVNEYAYRYTKAAHSKIWHEIVDIYKDEMLANDVLAALEDNFDGVTDDFDDIAFNEAVNTFLREQYQDEVLIYTTCDGYIDESNNIIIEGFIDSENLGSDHKITFTLTEDLENKKYVVTNSLSEEVFDFKKPLTEN